MVTSCCNAKMDIADTRRKNLQRLVQSEGLSVVARKCGKPDRQINDMLSGRKSFGEKVARAIEKKYAPEKPAGWLDAERSRSGYESPANSTKPLAVMEPSPDFKITTDTGSDRIKTAYESATEETKAFVDVVLGVTQPAPPWMNQTASRLIDGLLADIKEWMSERKKKTAA